MINLRAYYLKRFFIHFNFDFRVLPPKCLNSCVNGVLKFKFFFLNLSSKVLAGVIEGTSKYPYMDICDSVCAGKVAPSLMSLWRMQAGCRDVSLPVSSVHCRQLGARCASNKHTQPSSSTLQTQTRWNIRLSRVTR